MSKNENTENKNSITFLNCYGDLTVTWDKKDSTKMESRIQKLLDEGFQFFIVKKRFFTADKKTPLRSLRDLEINYKKSNIGYRLNNYITVDENGYINLTDSGMAIAGKIYERHTFLTSFLISIGVDPETAAEDACKIEHVISSESFSALKKYLADNEKN
jgi:hypothetical protein